MNTPKALKNGLNQLLLIFCSGVILLINVRRLNAARIACNACIYRAVVSNFNTHFYGSKSGMIDFEFQIPCTFYNPMITVSVPKSYKVNKVSLLPSNRIGQFENYETSCMEEMESSQDYKTERGIIEKPTSINTQSNHLSFNKLASTPISSCDLGKDAESELLEVLTSLGFQKWQVISQNASKCLDVPNYETKGIETLKIMGNLANGSYVLRFDLQNPNKEEFIGNWNLSITSTKNNMPTIPFCLTNINQTSVTNTVGPMLGPLNVRNVTFHSYYTASQKGEINFVIDSLNWRGSGKMVQKDSNIGDFEPMKIRLTFPLCETQSNCYSIDSKNSETFCKIYEHRYECYVERINPELVLTIGLSEVLNDNLSSIFPLKIGIKNLIIPLKPEPNNKLKIELLIPSVPSSKPEFLSLNSSMIEQITKKNQCIGQWVKYLTEDRSISNSSEYNNSSLIYSPISLGTYKLPKLKEINIQIRYRITNSDTYPILLKLGRINDKVQGNYNIRVKPLVEGFRFVKQGLDQRIAYSSILLNALIYDKSKLQEDISIEFDPKSDSVLLRNVDSKHPLECILLMENSNSNGNSKSLGQQFEAQKFEWEVEIFSINPDVNNNDKDNSLTITKKSILGEILDPRETEISEIGGPFVFVNSEEKYSMVVYFFLMGHQYNKMMTISLLIPKSVTEYVNTDLNVQIIPPETQNIPMEYPSEKLKLTKYSKGRILALTLESNDGFKEGWWGISIHITRPSVVDSLKLTEYVEFNVSSSVSTMGAPYLTSLLFLSVNENYKGPYLNPIGNKLQYVKGEDHIFQIISVQQNHSSFHPFPMLKDQIIGLETNSPSYFVTKLMYMEKFRFLYIISEPSLDGKEINLVTREIGNLGSSSCEIILVLGNGYHKSSKCDKAVKYSRLNKEGDTNLSDETKNEDLELVRKLLSKFLISRNRHTMSLITIVTDENQVEMYDNGIYRTKDIIPNERVNYNFIIKKNGELNTKKLRLDPSPTYYESYYQFRKALISTHYYNLYTVPSSIQALKVCPPETPILSHEKTYDEPLILKYKFFNEIISSYNYSVAPNIPGTCIKKGLITSSVIKVPEISGALIISLVLLVILI
ncbi:putative signal peptide-containing protein [Cryptosporidium canis]|uniref:Signal peptide-containing protein n=1 Tax=Cryptosporidium canis TaxID=195482 RepID=A0ABQ8P3D9_9CRYT|nr:putative signal peptide-containing protein [Cryptosporidium canis]